MKFIKPFKEAIKSHSINWDFLQHAETVLADMCYTSNTCFDIVEVK